MKEYDTPILAMVKALNLHVGEEVDLITLREDWWHELGDKEDNYLGHGLDKTVELFHRDLEVVYVRHPGWYTMVKIKVLRELQV